MVMHGGDNDSAANVLLYKRKRKLSSFMIEICSVGLASIQPGLTATFSFRRFSVVSSSLFHLPFFLNILLLFLMHKFYFAFFLSLSTFLIVVRNVEKPKCARSNATIAIHLLHMYVSFVHTSIFTIHRIASIQSSISSEWKLANLTHFGCSGNEWEIYVSIYLLCSFIMHQLSKINHRKAEIRFTNATQMCVRVLLFVVCIVLVGPM